MCMQNMHKGMCVTNMYTHCSIVFIVSYTSPPPPPPTHTHRCHHSAVEETTSWTPSPSVSSTPKRWELKRGMLHGGSSSGKRSLLPGTTLQMIQLVPTSYTSRWSAVSSLESTAVIRLAHDACLLDTSYIYSIVKNVVD